MEINSKEDIALTFHFFSINFGKKLNLTSTSTHSLQIKMSVNIGSALMKSMVSLNEADEGLQKLNMSFQLNDAEVPCSPIFYPDEDITSKSVN